MGFDRELSDRLGMSREEGERWIVDLVRDAKLDAKIDFKEVSLNSASSRPSEIVLTSSIAEHGSDEPLGDSSLPVCH